MWTIILLVMAPRLGGIDETPRASGMNSAFL